MMRRMHRSPRWYHTVHTQAWCGCVCVNKAHGSARQLELPMDDGKWVLCTSEYEVSTPLLHHLRYFFPWTLQSVFTTASSMSSLQVG
mmetsp:Transcript_2852/g.8718  ORF Transcript_2852/g.8718 Transcript_2852/m.8718 type:complete len:87 (-) Transcript_2852:377-637(-)